MAVNFPSTSPVHEKVVLCFATKLGMLLLLILALLFSQDSYCFVKSLNFSFNSFNSDSCKNRSSLICLGSVSASNGSLYLTPFLPEGSRKIGRVLFGNPVTAWPASFSTTFTVRFLINSSVSGDGIAFLIAQDDKPSPPQSSGSYIGMLDPSTEGGVLRQLAVELDSYQNEREPDDNHLALVTTSVESPVAIKSFNSTGIYIRSGREVTVKIDYDGWTKILNLSVAYAGNPLMSFLSHKIIMEDTVPQSAYVGFSASTAYLAESHQILSWNFTSFDLPGTSLKRSVGRNKTRIVLSVTIPTLVVLVLVSFIIIRKRQKERQKMKRADIEMLTRNAANAPRFFTYKQLSRATRNFNKENLLGAGGFGCVYKGVLSDASTILAVKKMNATAGQFQQGEKEYLAEICTIGRLRHKNLVQLQGWCHEKEQLFLVYEYMPNGSLDRYIGKIFLDWETRYNILTGLASALLYLHEECDTPVIHRDVKPNNVMLDSDYNAHLGDFGLARLLRNQTFVSTMVAGTPGYVAPEVSFTGRAAPESDVYSFGMVVLEVVCGQRTMSMTDENSLGDHVWTKHEKGELFTCVDPTLEGKFNEEQMRRTILVGLACLHPDRMFRPRIRKVVQIFLNPDEPLMEVPESRPTAINLPLFSSHCVSIEYDSINNPPCPSPLESLPDDITAEFGETDTKSLFTSN